MAPSDAAKRAARLANRTNGQGKGKRSTAWLFPASIAVILLAGLLIIFVVARPTLEASSGNTERPIAQLTLESTGFDHWHAGFSINICGNELPPVSDVQQDLLGIHTHSDGLIHIHPFSLETAGKRATMEKFFDQVGIEVEGDAIRIPQTVEGGDTFVSGESTCAGEDAEWVLAHWHDAEGAALADAPDELITEDFGSVHFDEDLAAYTLAFVPKDAVDEITAPSAAAQITILGACDGANPPPECAELLGDDFPVGPELPPMPEGEGEGEGAPGSDGATTGSGG